ncbi:MAG: hypothetical protein ACRDHO_01395 [Actinomycetota bacterium]
MLGTVVFVLVVPFVVTRLLVPGALRLAIRTVRAVLLSIPTLVLAGFLILQLPAWLRVVAFVLVALGLWGALLVLRTEERRQKFFTALRRCFGGLAPLFYVLNVIVLAISFFSSLTLFLERSALLPTTGSSGSSVSNLDSWEFYLWHLIDAIPGLKAGDTLHWQAPLTYQGAAVGWILLVFKGAIIIPAIASVRAYWKTRHDPPPLSPLSSIPTEDRVRAKEFFGPSVNWSRVQISDSVAIPPGIPAWTCGNVIRFHHPRGDDERPPLVTLVHELVHVWQFQNGRTPFLSKYGDSIESLLGGDPRDYGGPEGLQGIGRLVDLTPEAEATAVVTYFGLLSGYSSDYRGVPFTEEYRASLKRLVQGAGIGTVAPVIRGLAIRFRVEAAFAYVVNTYLGPFDVWPVPADRVAISEGAASL